MKKYLISTLTAAAAMVVPAFADAELLGSWDFTTAEKASDGTIKSSVAYAEDSYLYIKAAGSITSGALDINPSSDGHTTIDVSNANVTLTEGISIVMTVTDLSTGTSGGGRVNIWASIAANNVNGAAFIGENGSGDDNDREAGFAANGSDKNVEVTQDGYVSLHYPMTLTLTFVGDVLSLYEDGTLIAQATISASAYEAINGSITEVAIGSWDIDGNNNSTFGDFKISSLEIYKGDVMAVPEPELFSIFFGLGAVGLVATRRRRRVA